MFKFRVKSCMCLCLCVGVCRYVGVYKCYHIISSKFFSLFKFVIIANICFIINYLRLQLLINSPFIFQIYFDIDRANVIKLFTAVGQEPILEWST